MNPTVQFLEIVMDNPQKMFMDEIKVTYGLLHPNIIYIIKLKIIDKLQIQI